MVGDSTGHLQGKQGSGVSAEEKQGSSKQEAPSQGWGRRTTSGLATQVGGVATPGLYFLLRARAIQTHGASCGGWSYPPGKGSDVKSQETGRGEGGEEGEGRVGMPGCLPTHRLNLGPLPRGLLTISSYTDLRVWSQTPLTPQQALVSAVSAASVEHRQGAVVGRRRGAILYPSAGQRGMAQPGRFQTSLVVVEGADPKHPSLGVLVS